MKNLKPIVLLWLMVFLFVGCSVKTESSKDDTSVSSTNTQELDDGISVIDANIKAGRNPYRSSDKYFEEEGSLWFYNLNINDSFEQMKAKMAKFGVTEFAQITNILPQDLIDLGDCQAYIPHYNVYKKDLKNDFYIVLHKGKIIRFVKYQLPISESPWQSGTISEPKDDVETDFGYTVISYDKGILRHRMERQQSSGLQTVVITQINYAKYFERADKISNTIFRMNDLYFWNLKTNDSMTVANDKLKKAAPNSFEIKFSSNKQNERISLFSRNLTSDEYYILFQYFKRKYKNYDLGEQGTIQCGVIRERYYYGININCARNQEGIFFYFDTSKINANDMYSLDIPWGLYADNKAERNKYLSDEIHFSEEGSLWFYNLNINDSFDQMKTKMAEFGVTDITSLNEGIIVKELEELEDCIAYIPHRNVFLQDLTNDFYIVLHKGKIIRFIKYQLSVKDVVPIKGNAEQAWLENNAGYFYQEQSRHGLQYRVEKSPTGIQTVIITREDYLKYFERADKISDTIFRDNDLYFWDIKTDDSIEKVKEKLHDSSIVEYHETSTFLESDYFWPSIGPYIFHINFSSYGKSEHIEEFVNQKLSIDDTYILMQYFKRKYKNYNMNNSPALIQCGILRERYYYGLYICCNSGNYAECVDFYYFDCSRGERGKADWIQEMNNN